MDRNRPVVTGSVLRYQEQGHEQIVPVGSPAWYAWQRSARAFTFRALSAEYEFAVPPLAIPDLPRLPESQDLVRVATVALFLERARAVQSDFTIMSDIISH